MKTIRLFESGDKVAVTANRKWAVCTDNRQGGTEPVKVGRRITCTVIKAFLDYETGQRYVAKTVKGRLVYFGQFDVEVALL